jgi:hypothetical protein
MIKKSERILVMDGQRLVQSEQDDKWNMDKVEKEGMIKSGIYHIQLST